MYMGMKVQLLPPCMENLDDTRSCAEILLVRRQFQKCFGGASVHKRIQKCLVGVDERIQLSGESEYHMEIRCSNDLCSSAVNPDLFEDGLTIGTIAVSAGIAVEVSVAAVVADADIVAAISGLAAHDRAGSLVLNFRWGKLVQVLPKAI